MIDLNQLPEDILSTLVALPLRVGLYVSFSDETGGDTAQEEELRALENIVTFFVEDTLKSEFAQSIMGLSLQRRQDWGEWNGDLDRVPQECSEMIGYLSDHLDPRNLHAFKNNLLEIAIAVAMAYRETAQASMAFQIKMLWNNFMGRFKPPVSNSDRPYAYYPNISAIEKQAINKLAEALGIPYQAR